MTLRSTVPKSVLATARPERVEQPRQRVVAQLRAPTLVVQHVTRRRIAVPGREPDLAAAHLSQLGRSCFQERALELGDLVGIELEVNSERPAIGHEADDDRSGPVSRVP